VAVHPALGQLFRLGLLRRSFPRIAGADATRELRVILIQRPLDLAQLALLVFWERHDPPPGETVRRARVR
jgi:hypothetical protein